MKKIFLLDDPNSLSSSLASAKEWNKIRIATEGAYPPFSMIDNNGELVGLEIEFIDALCAEIRLSALCKIKIGTA